MSSMMEARAALIEQYLADAVTTEGSRQANTFETKLNNYADAVRQRALDDAVGAVERVDTRAIRH